MYFLSLRVKIQKEMKYDIIIYHGGCPDGISGAWCYRDIYDESVFYPGRHGKPPPDVKDKNVLMIDFSYPLEVMTTVIKDAKFVKVLDHHKSAEQLKKIISDKFVLILDQTKSGGQLAWIDVNSSKNIPMECSDKKFISEAGSRLSKTCDFAVLFRYIINSDEWCISLRADKASHINMASLAQQFGGGGHEKAAGFTICGSQGHNLRTFFTPTVDLEK